MSDIHRQRMQTRLDTVDEARELYEELAALDHSGIDTGRIIDKLKRASQCADSQHFDRHIVDALGLITAQARSAGESELADRARTLLEEFES